MFVWATFFPFDEMPSVSICFVKATMPILSNLFALSLKFGLSYFTVYSSYYFAAHTNTITVFPIVKISILYKLSFSFDILFHYLFHFSFSVYYAFIRRFLGNRIITLTNIITIAVHLLFHRIFKNRKNVVSVKCLTVN